MTQNWELYFERGRLRYILKRRIMPDMNVWDMFLPHCEPCQMNYDAIRKDNFHGWVSMDDVVIETVPCEACTFLQAIVVGGRL